MASSQALALKPAHRVIWIHVGIHKTGTTSIQAALAQDRLRRVSSSRLVAGITRRAARRPSRLASGR